jgi:hypothetical protein
MKKILSLSFVTILLLVSVVPLAAAKPGFGSLFYNGEVVRTIVPPSAAPKQGTDNFYKVDGGVEGQLGIAAVAPGNTDYHGGHWAFHLVTWNTEPYLLTSASAVMAAEAAGDVSVERIPSMDFKCPIQP